MGVVYRAEQTHPVRRDVALKLIKLGLDTRDVVARFQGERQALAMMDHPNVARVFDAGADDLGRPYFVMEFVPGDPITAYSDRAGSPIVSDSNSSRKSARPFSTRIRRGSFIATSNPATCSSVTSTASRRSRSSTLAWRRR